MAGLDGDLLPSKAQRLCDQLAEGNVGSASLRRGGDGDFQGPIQFSNNAVARRLGDDLNGQQQILAAGLNVDHGALAPQALLQRGQLLVEARRQTIAELGVMLADRGNFL